MMDGTSVVRHSTKEPTSGIARRRAAPSYIGRRLRYRNSVA